jgi:hypothetical protein
MRLVRDSDLRLLEQASRTPDAFAVFYRRHEAAVVAFLGRLSGDAQLTVDLTAETFARAYRARAQFDPARGGARARGGRAPSGGGERRCWRRWPRSRSAPPSRSPPPA